MEVTRALIHSVRVRKDKTLVCGVDVDDKHDLNKSMVEPLLFRLAMELSEYTCIYPISHR